MPMAVIEVEQPDIKIAGANMRVSQFTGQQDMHHLHVLLGQQAQQFAAALVAAANQPDSQCLASHDGKLILARTS